ncbi:MAG: type II toxin-antitoxin system death-on-curing family toxin [Bryobacter sp.]|jgi:death-on-curing protein|nr:type II toxin-antitoxin system death-on-curing family toxin [Bryobacter sp.]
MKPRKIRWLGKEAVLLLHQMSLAQFGGSAGLRDEGLLESALARPQNIQAYEPDSDLARLAAAYALGIAKNHPFVDGNKRAAFAALGVFLRKNGHDLTATQADATLTILRLAAGECSEDELAAWIRAHLAKFKPE